MNIRIDLFSLFIFVQLFGQVSSEHYYQNHASFIVKEDNLTDGEYIVTEHFNGNLLADYNSTRGKWKGHTYCGAKVADIWNGNTFLVMKRKHEKEVLVSLLVSNVALGKKVLGELIAKPNVTVKSVKLPSGRHPAMLVCSAYNFYPKQILVTWLRDGQEITTDVSYSDELPDGDFYYQFHSFLEYTPTSGETITCMVEHPTLTEPMLQHWELSLPQSERNQIIAGSIGLLIGFVFMTAGLIHYKIKPVKHSPLPQGQVVVPMECTGMMQESEDPEL